MSLIRLRTDYRRAEDIKSNITRFRRSVQWFEYKEQRLQIATNVDIKNLKQLRLLTETRKIMKTIYCKLDVNGLYLKGLCLRLLQRSTIHEDNTYGFAFAMNLPG